MAVCISADASRGLALRHHHGRNFMAQHFHKQIKLRGITPSYVFVAVPATNGVIERFFRTVKEQVVHGRIYQTIAEVRDAVCRFVAQWLIEKNAYRSLYDARAACNQAAFSQAAQPQPCVQKAGCDIVAQAGSFTSDF